MSSMESFPISSDLLKLRLICNDDGLKCVDTPLDTLYLQT